MSDARTVSHWPPKNVSGHVTTITKVAGDLGEDEDWLRDVANEMEFEDGAIWVYGLGEDSVQAFTDFRIERLIDLIQIYKEIRSCLSAGHRNNPTEPAAGTRYQRQQSNNGKVVCGCN
ncbi:hypothetical protein [Bradyrhizobium sp. USDA 10063]